MKHMAQNAHSPAINVLRFHVSLFAEPTGMATRSMFITALATSRLVFVTTIYVSGESATPTCTDAVLEVDVFGTADSSQTVAGRAVLARVPWPRPKLKI